VREEEEEKTALLGRPLCANLATTSVFHENKSHCDVLVNILYASSTCLHLAYKFTTAVMANKLD